MLLNTNGCKENPINFEKPENRSPIMLSLTVFPSVIDPTDSAIVICHAMDPNGDILVYDWITDGKSRIKGANPCVDNELYYTYENHHIVYPEYLNNIIMDTLWIQCFARDGKGKPDNSIVHFIVRK